MELRRPKTSRLPLSLTTSILPDAAFRVEEAVYACVLRNRIHRKWVAPCGLEHQTRCQLFLTAVAVT